MRDGGKASGGSRVDVLTSKKGRQAASDGFSLGSLYIWVTAGRLFSPQLIPFKKKILTQTYPEALLLVDSRSNKVNNQVP